MDKGELEFGASAFSKMVMHAIKYPHALCCGLLLSPASVKEQKGDDLISVSDAIPISHISNYLAPNMEIAYNSISAYASDHDMIISGYYQTNRTNESNQPDIFSQKIAEKIQETFQKALICIVKFDVDPPFSLNVYQNSDGKWRRLEADETKVDTDPEVLAENIIYSKEKLYRNIVDFDEHFDDISLDWTNSKVGQRVDYLVANVC